MGCGYTGAVQCTLILLLGQNFSQPPSTPQTDDRRMLGVLKKNGTQSLEGFSTLAGIGWAQVFMSVDRLSLTGKVFH